MYSTEEVPSIHRIGGGPLKFFSEWFECQEHVSI